MQATFNTRNMQAASARALEREATRRSLAALHGEWVAPELVPSARQLDDAAVGGEWALRSKAEALTRLRTPRPAYLGLLELEEEDALALALAETGPVSDGDSEEDEATTSAGGEAVGPAAGAGTGAGPRT